LKKESCFRKGIKHVGVGLERRRKAGKSYMGGDGQDNGEKLRGGEVSSQRMEREGLRITIKSLRLQEVG